MSIGTGEVKTEGRDVKVMRARRLVVSFMMDLNLEIWGKGFDKLWC